jgi:AcrR family transcriptional regulator
LPAKAQPKRVVSNGARRKRRTSEDILNRIVQAATEEFKRSGYAEATTATIARKAEVTEAQLFRYFGSKANLFRETIFNPLQQHFLAFTDKYMPDGLKPSTFGAMADPYTTDLQRFIAENIDMITSVVVAQTYERGAPQGVGDANSLKTYFDRGASILSMWIDGKPKVAPELMVRVSFVAVLACIMFKDWIFPPGMASDEEIRAAVNDFVMEGLAANWPGGLPSGD